MEISEWLEQKNISLLQLAKKAQISPGTLYSAFSKGKGVSERIAEKISRATKEKVTVEEAMNPPRFKFEDWRKRPKKVQCRFCRSMYLP